MRIFVSYTLRDKELSKNFLKQVYDHYSIFGKVFLDLISNDSNNKQERVLQELDLADKLIVIETSNVYNSDWVNLEIERILLNGKPIEKIGWAKLKSIIEKKAAAKKAQPQA